MALSAVICLCIPSSEFIYLHVSSFAFISLHLHHLPSSFSICLHLPSDASICIHLPSSPFTCFHFLHFPVSTFLCLHLPSFPFICFHLASIPSSIFNCLYLPPSPFICLHMLSIAFISCLHLSSFAFIWVLKTMLLGWGVWTGVQCVFFCCSVIICKVSNIKIEYDESFFLFHSLLFLLFSLSCGFEGWLHEVIMAWFERVGQMLLKFCCILQEHVAKWWKKAVVKGVDRPTRLLYSSYVVYSRRL